MVYYSIIYKGSSSYTSINVSEMLYLTGIK